MKKVRRAPVVVDTNVPVVANQNDGEDLTCAAICARKLHEITRTGLLVIDAQGLIFTEYKNNLSFAGRPGAGDYFFKWLSDNRYKTDRIEQIELTVDPNRQDEFEIFPNDPGLADFDRSDRKFVALVLSHPEKPPILNATDSDWWTHRDALQAHGVNVDFLCGVQRFELSLKFKRP